MRYLILITPGDINGGENMSCSNPQLMAVIDSSSFNIGQRKRFEDQGWKFNLEDNKGYRLVSRESRSHFLEMIPEYINREVIEVPCGGCIGCRLDYSREWANRCTLEASQYQYNYFITLSYDDEHLPLGSSGNNTLVRSHVQTFLKELRTKFKRKFNHIGIKFFGCAEYGDQSFRSHYHIILFNCPIPDLTLDFVDENGQISRHRCQSTGDSYYYSQFVKDCWKYGHILIADANWNTAAYVSRYVLKKQKGNDKKLYDELGVSPPFVFMSNRPGIGLNYYKSNRTFLSLIPQIIMARPHKNPLVSGLPRYYMKKLKVDDKASFDRIKANNDVKFTRNFYLHLGHQKINDSRQISEDNIRSKSKAFNRDF